jgi:FixJ family two-component response regulator
MAKGRGEGESVVFVVDDDAAMRQAITSLLRSVGLKVESFGSAADVFKEGRMTDGISAACLILDVRLPGISGLDFQAALSKADIHIPIIFITGHGDVPMTVRAMKAGAVEFMTKPFRDHELLEAVQTALAHDHERRSMEKPILDMRARLATLSPREQEVFGFVTTGLMNKQIAVELGVSEITVKVHRGNVMKKMGARSLADLTRMANTLDVLEAKH